MFCCRSALAVARSAARGVYALPIQRHISVCGVRHLRDTGSASFTEIQNDMANPKTVNWFSHRTHTCGELREEHVGQNVTLCGWMTFKRHYRDTLFVVLRDIYGKVQLCLSEGPYFDMLSEAPLESVVEVHGNVIRRPEKDLNPRMATGDVEVIVSSVKVVGKGDLVPFQINGKGNMGEPIRLKYRYLDLRSTPMQQALIFRSKLTNSIRQYLANELAFLEIETPTLFCRSPGGAREFIVPTKAENSFYSLVQSPQQFKQMLMCGGLDRYFQFARCYRDESGTVQRQPEFTQLDMELSFTTEEDIINLVERIVCHSWPATSWPHLPALSSPFPRMTYDTAMRQYGCDKPDTRFDIKIHDVSAALSQCQFLPLAMALEQGTVQAVCVPNGSKLLTGKERSSLELLAKEAGLTCILVRLDDSAEWQPQLQSKISAEHCQAVNSVLTPSPNDLLVLVAGQQDAVLPCLGAVRLRCAELLQSHGVELYDKQDFKFLWVHSFPLFETSEDGEGLESCHHPFTAPHEDDIALLDTAPLKVRAQHYDLVLNGVEVGGGSIRIHHAELQRKILEDLLKLDIDKFEHLLDMLSCGCPPHGGIALGLDRYVSILAGRRNIREVIAFPKTSSGRDVMSGAPSSVSKDDLKELFLKVVPDDTKQDGSE